jgi:hypothetical protein
MVAWQDGLDFFHGFRLPAIASSSEASGDEAEKRQFCLSGKKGRGSDNGWFFSGITVVLWQ